MDASEIKIILHQKCLEWLENKIAIATKARDDAQESANSEEKNSAGDKFETGRAMSQNERDMYAHQLVECNKQKQTLLSIDLSKKYEQVAFGSLVKTDSAAYFISISIGPIIVERITYFAVSSDTPIAKLLLKKRVGEEFVFNNNKNCIREIV